MARRSDHTRDELKAMAIAAGTRLIEAKGFGAFSARAVAAEIGYTVGTLYNVFGNLDTLVLHINAGTLDLWYDALAKKLATRPKQPLHALARAYIQFARSHYHRWSALFEHRLDESAAIPDWYAAKMARFFALVEDALPATIAPTPKARKRTANVLWAGIHGICILGLSNKLAIVGAESVEVLADELVARVLSDPPKK